MRDYLTPKVRRWIYGLCLAALPLLLHYGLLDAKAVPLWGAFALALFFVSDDEG